MMKKVKKLIRTLTLPLPDNFVIYAEYILRHRKLPNLKHPKGFNEKINYIKQSDWLLTKQMYVDKYKVRPFIEATIGEQYLATLYGVYKSADEVNLDELPQSFVLKLNNGSGCNLVVKDKDTLNKEEVHAKLERWLTFDFYKTTREKQYKDVEQFIICEEYLEDSSGELRDYKFFCFNGEMKFVQVDTGRVSGHVQTFYDKNWVKQDFTYVQDATDVVETRPVKYDEMVNLAEKLAKNFPFVRVDFYDVNGRIVFGEITFTPNNGMILFKPQSKELELGALINEKAYD